MLWVFGYLWRSGNANTTVTPALFRCSLADGGFGPQAGGRIIVVTGWKDAGNTAAFSENSRVKASPNPFPPDRRCFRGKAKKTLTLICHLSKLGDFREMCIRGVTLFFDNRITCMSFTRLVFPGLVPGSNGVKTPNSGSDIYFSRRV